MIKIVVWVDQSMNLINMSGGKDSTALALLAIERKAIDLRFVFADTGHEHQITYDYLDYLESKLKININRVKANFNSRIANKREIIKKKWPKDGISQEKIQRALKVLRPTGNPFLDLCLCKGRFPSTRGRFCSEELKHKPIEKLQDQYLSEFEEVISWQGVRKDESRQRAKLVEEEDHPTKQGLTWYRPILDWTAKDVFDFHRRHNIEPNPLYKQGMGRVGCMPCIHARKGEIKEIAYRFPEEIRRVAEWEKIVSEASKQNISTFMDARVICRLRGEESKTENIKTDTHGIDAYVKYSRTTRGGRMLDLLTEAELNELPTCSSIYGLCE